MVVHYRPSGRSPRCKAFKALSEELQIYYILAKKASATMTTDIEKVTCSSCISYIMLAVQNMELRATTVINQKGD